MNKAYKSASAKGKNKMARPKYHLGLIKISGNSNNARA